MNQVATLQFLEGKQGGELRRGWTEEAGLMWRDGAESFPLYYFGHWTLIDRLSFITQA